MTDSRAGALDADREERIVDAASAYEALIATGAACQDDYLNLSVLYLSMVSTYAPSELPDDLHGHAWARSTALPVAAEVRFGPGPAILFW